MKKNQVSSKKQVTTQKRLNKIKKAKQIKQNAQSYNNDKQCKKAMAYMFGFIVIVLLMVFVNALRPILSMMLVLGLIFTTVYLLISDTREANKKGESKNDKQSHQHQGGSKK